MTPSNASNSTVENRLNSDRNSMQDHDFGSNPSQYKNLQPANYRYILRLICQRRASLAAALCIIALLGAADSLPAQVPFDLVIRNGKVIDGTGNPWFYADVAIAGGKI